MSYRKRLSVVLPVAVFVGLCALTGCGGGDGGTTGPELGAEVDLSLYEPVSLDDYLVTFRLTTVRDTIEASSWYVGTEVVVDYDPVTGEETPVECVVLQEEPYGAGSEMRYYSDGSYVYGVKVYGGGTWEPLYYMRPKMKVAPDTNPRINGVFDSGGSNLVFPIEDAGIREDIWLRTWITYLAVEDSMTVPAGTFYNVLKTKERQRTCYKRTAYADTSAVVPLSEYVGESESLVWSAPGIGTIRVTSGSGSNASERVLISATIDGVDYPVGKEETGRIAGNPPPGNRSAERPPDLLSRGDESTTWTHFWIHPGLPGAR